MWTGSGDGAGVWQAEEKQTERLGWDLGSCEDIEADVA